MTVKGSCLNAQKNAKMVLHALLIAIANSLIVQIFAHATKTVPMVVPVPMPVNTVPPLLEFTFSLSIHSQTTMIH